jgi:uncharacterized protein (TIGR03545 family)
MAVALVIGLNPLLRWALIFTGQRVTGARVELGQVNSQFWKSRLALVDLAIANPQKTGENVLECAAIDLDLNTRALLHKRWVIDRGSLSGLQLGELRGADGALPTDPAPTPGDSNWSDQARAAGEAWFHDASRRLNEDLDSNLKSPALARELSGRWPREYERLQTRARLVRDEAKRLEADARQWKDNPWTAVEHLPTIAGRVDHLRTEGLAIKQQLEALRTQLLADRQAVAAARQHDQAYLREQLTLEQLKPEALTEYLVDADWKPYVDQLIGWVRWSRQHMSNRPSGAAAAGRGLTIDFSALDPQPRWLCRQLELDGAGTANSQPFAFRGTLFNWTSDPRLLGKPAELTVQLTGAHQADVTVVIDHTRPVPIESLDLACPRLVQPGRLLGKADGLAMELQRGIGSLQAQFKLQGEQLDGTIALHRPDITLTPRIAADHQAASLQTALHEAAGAVRQLDVRVQLSGHWKRPEWKIRSDMGPQLAAGMNRALHSELARRGERLMAAADSVVAKELDQLESQVEQKKQEILSDLNLSQEQLSWVKQQLTALRLPAGLPQALPGGLPASKSAVQDALRKVLR